MLVAGLILIAMVGCGGGSSGGAVASDPPTISLARVEMPDGFSFMGGNVTLKTIVVADAGVSSVNAKVDGPSGSSDVSLKLLAGGIYSATYRTEANTRSDGTAMDYTAMFSVTDKAGRKATSGPVAFAVPAPPGPPPPP